MATVHRNTVLSVGENPGVELIQPQTAHDPSPCAHWGSSRLLVLLTAADSGLSCLLHWGGMVHLQEEQCPGGSEAGPTAHVFHLEQVPLWFDCCLVPRPSWCMVGGGGERL